MLKTIPVLFATALLGALAAPALAQDGNLMASTQYPPSQGLSNEGIVQPLNSMPRTAATAERERPGSDIGTTQVEPTRNAAAADAGADARTFAAEG